MQKILLAKDIPAFLPPASQGRARVCRRSQRAKDVARQRQAGLPAARVLGLGQGMPRCAAGSCAGLVAGAPGWGRRARRRLQGVCWLILLAFAGLL